MTRRKTASALPVHMNGRIYDPLLGRFLSADVLVPSPGDLQSHNRYSYTRNNPLSLVDPSGYTETDPADEEARRRRVDEQNEDPFRPGSSDDPFTSTTIYMSSSARASEGASSLAGGASEKSAGSTRGEENLEGNRQKPQAPDGELDPEDPPTGDPERRSSDQLWEGRSLWGEIKHRLNRNLGNYESPQLTEGGQKFVDAWTGLVPDRMPDRVTGGLALGLKLKTIENGAVSTDVGLSADYTVTKAFDNYFDSVTKAEASIAGKFTFGPFEMGGGAYANASERPWSDVKFDAGGKWDWFKVNSGPASTGPRTVELTLLLVKVGVSWDPE